MASCLQSGGRGRSRPAVRQIAVMPGAAGKGAERMPGPGGVKDALPKDGCGIWRPPPRAAASERSPDRMEAGGRGCRDCPVNISEAIGRRSRAFVSALATALIGGAVAARYVVPARFSVAFVFLLPISFATWFLSWPVGAAIAAAGAVFLFYFDLKFGSAGAAGAWWNGFINLTVGSLFIFIFAELRSLYLKQIELSRRDPLTGLLNRRAFLEMVDIETRRMARHRHPLTIAYVDVDNFKFVNDRYGHAAGDEFLQHLARNMSARLRGTDFLARVGGDEFAILLPETDEPAARHVLGDIHQALPRFSFDRDSAVTVSAGAVTFSATLAADEMIALADRAMYTVKRNGKNDVAFRLAG
jgi:diguanylate cyclase (GGDEF)-like protein